MSKSSSHLSYTAYVAGFVGSLVLTLVSYFAVTTQAFTPTITLYVIGFLAIVQFVVQLFCFLHLGQEDRPRWRLRVFAFMLGVIIILVFGSIWIMNNLNYNMSHGEVKQYLEKSDSF